MSGNVEETGVMVQGTHLSDPQALVVLGPLWGQRSPGALSTLGNLENLISHQNLEGQNLEDPPARSHPFLLGNL